MNGPTGPRGITGPAQPLSDGELARLYRLKYGDPIRAVPQSLDPTRPPAPASASGSPSDGVHACALDGHKIENGTPVYCEGCVSFLLGLRSLAAPPDSN